MTKGGIIIRLIDVAMIILFGFIVISDIKVKAQIKLPSREQSAEPEQTKQRLIFVHVGADDTFTVTENQVPLTATASLEALEATLTLLHREAQSTGADLVVVIDPHQDSIMQRTVDVLDICERNQIPKSIKY